MPIKNNGSPQKMTESKNGDNFKKIFELAGDGILLVDMENKKFFMGNKAICRMLGYTEEEIKNLWVTDIHPKKDLPFVLEQFEAMAGGRLFSVRDIPLKRRDGAILYADINTTFITLGKRAYLLGLFHDNTARMEKERILRESEDKYRSIYMASRDAIMTLEPPGWKFTSANPETLKMFNARDEKEFLSYEPWRLSPEFQPDGRPSGEKAIEEIEKAMRDGYNFFEWAHKRIGGEEFMANVLLSKVAQGGKVYLHALVRDLSEEKKASAALKSSEYKYKTLLENLPQKIFLKDRQSVYISCNENYARDLKIKADDITGKTDYDFFPTHLAEKYRADDRRVMESGRIENIEEEYMVIGDFLKDPKEVFINTVKVPTRDEEGNVTGVLGIFWDITERKKAEEEVSKLNKRIEFVLEVTKTGFDIIDSDLNMVYVDPAWQKVYGDPAGKKCYSYFMDKEKTCPGCGVARALETKKPVVTEEVLVKEGNRPIEVTTIPFQDRNGKWFVAEINVDITERKRLEKEVKRAETLKIAADIKSKFISMVSHELRSPLAAVKEGVNIVLEGLVGTLNGEQKNLLDTAKRNIDRLGRLINNVLDFQKIDSGKMAFDILNNDLNAIVVEAGKAISILAAEKGLDLEVNTDDDMPGVKFDKDRIVQVVTNLLSNAIKFTEKGGIYISTMREGDMAHVTVRDTGRGIRAEDMPKIFKPFEQFGSGMAGNKGGTGLGLAIAEEIIIAHNGKIWVESEVGKGTTFHFTLPLNGNENSGMKKGGI